MLIKAMCLLGCDYQNETDKIVFITSFTRCFNQENIDNNQKLLKQMIENLTN